MNLDFSHLLPLDIQNAIYVQLPIKAVVSLSGVNKKMHSLMQSEHLWKTFFAKDFPSKMQKLQGNTFFKNRYITHYKIQKRWRQGKVRKKIQHLDGAEPVGDIFYRFPILACAYQNIFFLQDLQTDTSRFFEESEHILSLCFEKERVALALSCNRISLWQNEARYTYLEGHDKTITGLSMEGGLLASASEDASVRVWDVETRSCLRVLKGHTAPVACLQLHGGQVISGDNSGTVRLWDVQSGACLKTFSYVHCAVTALCFDKQRIVWGDAGGVVRLWDAANDRVSKVGSWRAILSLQLQDQLLALSVTGRAPLLIDMQSYTTVWDCKEDLFHSFRLQFDGERLITFSTDGVLGTCSVVDEVL